MSHRHRSSTVKSASPGIWCGTVPFPILRAEYDNTIALLEPTGDRRCGQARLPEKLGAVVLFTKPEQDDQITNLAKELEQFDYVPKVRTSEEYGK
jgi:hypothetical protein